MTFDTETVLDRRRLKRQITLWRGLGLAGVAIALATVWSQFGPGGRLANRPQIARITVSGVITDTRAQTRLLNSLAEAKHVAAVIVDVNSPGGTTTGGEALFVGLRRIAEKKPVVAQFGTVAASAAYITGLATDHIVARGNTITGSVGVIVQWPEFSGLLDKAGVKINEIKSGSLKAVPSPYAPLDERGRKITEEMVAESQAWFVGLVESRRGIKAADVPGLLDGRIFSGREAVRLKLVDEIGAEPEVLRWLEDKRGVAKGLKIIDWKPRTEFGLAGAGGGSLMESWIIGPLIDAISTRAKSDPTLGALTLDGLVSIGHVPRIAN
jgi:protease IV